VHVSLLYTELDSFTFIPKNSITGYHLEVLIFFGGIKFWVSHLLGRHSTTWPTLPALFCFIFQVRDCSLFCLGLASDCDLPTYSYLLPLPTASYTWLIDWDKNLSFCLGWPQTVILLIPNSQIARITGSFQSGLSY
jgi:hypothetical protein